MAENDVAVDLKFGKPQAAPGSVPIVPKVPKVDLTNLGNIDAPEDVLHPEKRIPGIINLSGTDPTTMKDVGKDILLGGERFSYPYVVGKGASTGYKLGSKVPIPGAGLVGGALGAVGAGVAGQKLQEVTSGRPEKNSVLSDLFGFDRGTYPAYMANALQTQGENIVGGKVGEFLIGKGKSMIGPAIQKDFNFPGSVATGTGGSFANWFEKTFAPKAREERLTKTGEMGYKTAGDLLSDLSKRPMTDWSDENQFGIILKGQYDKAIEASKAVSNMYGNRVDSIARNSNATTVPIITGYKEQPNINPATGQPYGKFQLQPSTTKVPIVENRTIEGPIHLGLTAGAADGFLRSTFGPDYTTKSREGLFKTIEESDPKLKKAVSAAFRVLDAGVQKDADGNPLRDPSGKIVRTPVPFRLAWDLQQAVGNTGYAPGGSNFANGKFRTFYNLIGKDMERSMRGWNPADRDVAIDSLKKAKAVVQARMNNLEDSAVGGFEDITGSGVKEARAVISDPVELQKAINGGMRKEDFGATKLQSVLVDAYDPATKTFDGDKIRKGWNDPKSQMVKGILYDNPQQRARFDNFIEELATASQEHSAGTPGLPFQIGRAGVYIAAPLLGMKGHPELGGTILGLTVGSHYLAKEMQRDSTVTRLMTSMLKTGGDKNANALLGKALYTTLAGSVALARLQNGSEVPVRIEKTGDNDVEVVPIGK